MKKIILVVLCAFLLQITVAYAIPLITINSPIQNELLNVSTVFISASSNNISTFSYSIDSSAFDSFGQNVASASTYVNTSEGSHYLTVKAIDSSGSSESSVNFSVDITAPAIILNYPENSTVMETQEAAFVFTVSDNFAESINCSLLINGKHNQSKILENPQKFQFTEIISEGNSQWSISCRDKAGNKKTETRYFSVDSVCGLTAYGIGVQNNNITFFLKNTGTKSYFSEYTTKVDLDKVGSGFIQLKVGESKLIQQNFSFEDNQNYLIEAFANADCGSMDSLSMQYSKVGPVCTSPEGFVNQIKCDESNQRLIQCLSGGDWGEYNKEDILYCNSCLHCGDGAVNCGETPYSCQEDYKRQGTCDCSNRRQIVESIVFTGIDFYNACKGICDLGCTSDFQCSTGFCSNFKCEIKPGSCKLSLDNLEYSSQTGLGTETYLLSKIKNIGKISTNVSLIFKDGNSILNESKLSLLDSEEYIKAFYFTLSSPGVHKLSLKANAACGFSTQEDFEIEVINKQITNLNLRKPLVTTVDLTPLLLLIDEGKENALKLNIKSTKPQIFSLNVSGVPENWISYPKLIGTGREKDVFIYLLPRNSGNYNLSVVLYGENEAFVFNPLLTVSEKEIIGETSLIVALGIFAALFIVILYFAFRRFGHEDVEWE